MNLEEAITASDSCLACRVVDNQRVIVDRGQKLLTVHVQRCAKRRWVVDDEGGGVRYLAGVIRDGMGRYLSLSPANAVSDIEQIRMLLPLRYQALLLLTSDDWHAIERGDL